MASIINSQTTRYQLDKNFNKLFIEEQTRKKKYFQDLVTAKDAPPGEFIQEGRMTELGLAPVLLEGQRPSFDTPTEGNKILRYYMKRGLSIQLTEERMMDDIGGTWKQLPKQLVTGIDEGMELDVANVLNNGLTTASIGEDSAALFGTHNLLDPRNNGSSYTPTPLTITNLGAAALSTTSFQAALQYGRDMVKENGFKMPVRLTTLLVAPDSEWIAIDLMKQSGRVWTGMEGSATGNAAYINSEAANLAKSGGIGTMLGESIGTYKLIVNPFLKSGTWYAMYEGFEFPLYWKFRPRLVKDEDVAGTDNLIYTAKARYSTFINKYKFIYRGNS